MTAQLLIAPAGSGKTAYAVTKARRAAQRFGHVPHVLVASALQAQDFRRRLAESGGAIGVRVLTFEDLYRVCLRTTDAAYAEIRGPVQQRVIRSVIRQLSLEHYASIAGRPGFVRALQEIIDELKAAQVPPESYAQAVAARGSPPRLVEIGEVYAAYQARLQAEDWADPAGLGWLAVEALERAASRVGADWPLLLVDGFDDFTPVQLAVLARLVERPRRTVITLTGTMQGPERVLAHGRFERTRRELLEALDIDVIALPDGAPRRAPVLEHLEAGLMQRETASMPVQNEVELIEAANRAQEVRAALRWLKNQIVEHGLSPRRLALLMRDVTPYRPFVRQIAAEFGLPVHIYSGEPLRENPCVAALIDLLRLTLPGENTTALGQEEGSTSGPSLPPRLVIATWRSPYFDWQDQCRADHAGLEEGETRIGIEPSDADALGVVARRGRVISGLDQWEAAFEALAGTGSKSAQSRGSSRSREEAAEARDPEEDEGRRIALTGCRVQDLRGKFLRFVDCVTPPEGPHTARHFVGWLERLIGPDPEGGSSRFAQPESAASLNVIAQVRGADEDRDTAYPLATRDLTALRCLKEILRGLIWAEEALDDPLITFPRFLEDLISAIEAASYRMPRRPLDEEILIADVVAARGTPFEAVAVLGMAEGVFPEPQREDPLLWDTDREDLDLPLEPSVRSAEAEYFYETISAASQRILLTRPRLTDEGAPWEPSPFWEEIRRLVDVEPAAPNAPGGPDPGQAASWQEVIQSACASPGNEPLWHWLRENSRESLKALEAAAQVVAWRQNRADSPFDGGLHSLREAFTRRFHSGHTWSASRLEAYRTCPFYFFVSKVLRLEPREEPAEGLSWLQRGNLYHEILERVYQAVEDPADLDELLNALPAVAEPLLDQAPEQQGFRRTAWWRETRQEILEDVRRSLEALSTDDQRGDFIPTRFEAAFGLRGEPPLIVSGGDGDAFQLRGLIDRVDQDIDGRIRIIDYKTGGPSKYTAAALRNGERIQLALYALAAREALDLGQPVSGFYWHVRHAEPSPFTLEDFGPQQAIDTAVAHAWEAIRSARQGRFAPCPPNGGCPPYCPATPFCWHYEPRYGAY